MNAILMKIYVGAIILLSVGIFLFCMIMMADQRRIDTLRPMAVKYEEICGGVRATLRVDRERLHGDRYERQTLIDRFGHGCGDDGITMLDRCLDEPFPIYQWRACADRGDVACLDELLSDALDELP